MQSNADIGQSSCEQQFGVLNFDGNHPLHEVVRSPGQGFLTNTSPLFANGKCYNNPSDGHVFPNRDGTVQCAASGAETDTVEDVDAKADSVDNSSHALDYNPAARHSSVGASPPAVRQRRAAREFRG